MKLKKIVSALLAFSMISSMGIMSVNAEDYANPIIHVDSEVFTDTSAQYYKPVDGYTTYLVSYSIEGIDYSNGGSIAGLTIDYNVSGESGVDYLEKSFVASVKSGATNKRDLNGIYAETAGRQMISAKQIVFASADGLWDFIDWDTYPDGSPANVKTTPVIQTLIYVKDGSSVNFTYNVGLEASKTPSKIVLSDDTEYLEEIVYKVNGATTNKLTLGAAPDPTPVITGNTAKKAATAGTAKGIVWNNVSIENVTKGINWKVIFTDNSLTEDNTATFDLDINNMQIDGDISFAVVLKTDKNADNITMSFDYDAAPAE